MCVNNRTNSVDRPQKNFRWTLYIVYNNDFTPGFDFFKVCIFKTYLTMEKSDEHAMNQYPPPQTDQYPASPNQYPAPPNQYPGPPNQYTAPPGMNLF